MTASVIPFPIDRARRPGEWAPRRTPADVILIEMARASDRALVFWLAWWCDSWLAAAGLKPICQEFYAGEGSKPCDS